MQAVKMIKTLSVMVGVVLAASNCFGQTDPLKAALAKADSVRADSVRKECQNRMTQIRDAYYLGNSTRVDSLYTFFISSECRKDTTSYVAVLEIMADQRHKDGYRKAEQDIRTQIQDLTRKQYRSRPVLEEYKYQYITGEFMQGMRFSSDLVQGLGIKAGMVTRSGFGFDIGIHAQDILSNIERVDNRSESGLFKRDGIYFRSTTTSRAYNASLLGTWMGTTEREYGDGPKKYVSGGFFAGLDVFTINKTRVRSYYVEHNYTDSLIGENEHQLRFNTVSNFDGGNRFYTPKISARVLVGMQIRFTSGRLFYSLSLHYATPSFNRFQVYGFDKEIYARTDYFVFAINVGVINIKAF